MFPQHGIHWQCTEAGRQPAFAARLASPQALLAGLARPVSGDPAADNCVYRIACGDVACFAKFYREPSGWQALWHRRRGTREWRNLRFFHRIGVAAPRLLARGRWQDAMGRRWSVLVTEAVPEAVDMAALMRHRPDYFAHRAWFAALCRALAAQVRCMHQARFAHNDLNWRNVLVVAEPEPAVWLFDCPSGRRWLPPFWGFRRAKDLTHLDKLARRHLSRSQRLRFFLAYTGHARLTAADRRLLSRILHRRVNDKYRPPARS